ncbi:MAG: TIR domain-containing protein [Candidatus Hodarchaeota archaeon]
MSEKLDVVKELINLFKLEEALQQVKDIEQSKNLTSEEMLRTLAYKARVHFDLGELEKAFKIAEELFEKSQEMKLPLFSSDALFIKRQFFSLQARFEEADKTIEQHENLFKSIPREDSLEYQERKAYLLLSKGVGSYYQAALDLALTYFNESLALFEQVDPHSIYIATNLWAKAYVYYLKGELHLAVEYNEKASVLIPEAKYFWIGFSKSQIYQLMGRIYSEKGDFTAALEYYIRVLDIYKSYNFAWMGQAYLNIISVLVAQNNGNQAWNYLQQFKDFNQKQENKAMMTQYHLAHALILKSSPRMRDRTEAETILKKIVELENWDDALIHLCDLYFEEFQQSNHMEILDDIQPLIDQLQRNAKQENSYSLLANVKLLQAKVALLQINMVEARKLLTEAQDIAYEHDLQRLAGEISREHDRLLEELKLWDSIKKTRASVTERLKLASVDDVIERMQGRLAIEPLEAIEEQPVVLLILIEGNILLLSYPFSEKWKQDDNLLTSFLSAFSTFRDEYFSQGLDRAKFGEETLLLQTPDSFLVCYLFKGQTYSAKQKINYFSDALIKNTQIIEDLKSASENKKPIEVADYPHIEELIIKSFMSDLELFQTPFKAYEGDEPFVFASYAHADKLEVYPIIDYLNKMNIKIWYDEGIAVSDNWIKSIAVNIERCRAFIVFITPQIINSEYVRKEISFALKKRKPFFAVYLKDTKLPAELEFEIADIQAMMMYLMPKSEFQTDLKELLFGVLDK